jgi:hypothetical protein
MEAEVIGENLPEYRNFHHRSNMTSHGFEPVSPRLETDD